MSNGNKKQLRAARNSKKAGKTPRREHKAQPTSKRWATKATREAAPYSMQAVEISDWITVFMPNGAEAAYCGLSKMEQIQLRKALREGVAKRSGGVIYADEVHFDL